MPGDLLTALGLALGLSISAAVRQFAKLRILRGPRMAGEQDRTGMWDVIRSWVEGKTQVALERERRSTRVETLNQLNGLPPGASITEVSGPGVSVIIQVPVTHCPVADPDHDGVRYD